MSLIRDAVRFVEDRVFALGVILRVALVLYAAWHDAALPVRYTDADYFVFRDAASLVASGSTPYARATYRYPPLVAWLLAPGEAAGGAVGAVWGKALFCVADMAVGAALFALLLARGEVPRAARRAAALWLLSPLAATASSRGSSDALAVLLVILSLWGVEEARRRSHAGTSCIIGGLAIGAAIHVRLFPVIYVLPLAIALTPSPADISFSSYSKALVFASSSVLALLVLTISAFFAYGSDAITEAYLFHLRRVDARHNFSVLWHSTYLESAIGGPGAPGPLSGWGTWVATIMGAIVATRDPSLAALVATLCFVACNGVVTAQYFNWWAALMPLIATRSRITPRLACCVGCIWTAAELHWLFWAYKLEFRGEPVHHMVGGAAIAFFAANVLLVITLLLTHKFDRIEKKAS